MAMGSHRQDVGPAGHRSFRDARLSQRRDRLRVGGWSGVASGICGCSA